MSKFKVGDRVRVVRPSAPIHGATGTIEDILEDLSYIVLKVRMDKTIAGLYSLYFKESDLEIVYTEPNDDQKAENESLWDMSAEEE